jgi:hypothetical protein
VNDGVSRPINGNRTGKDPRGSRVLVDAHAHRLKWRRALSRIEGLSVDVLEPPHLLRVENKGRVCRASLKLGEMTPSRYRNTQAIRDIDGSDKV